MSGRIRVVCLVWFIVAAVAAGARGQNPGLEDLDRATELKLTARSLNDLAEVIRRCESALEKGLDGDHRPFAEQLLASTRIRRGLAIGEEIFKQVPATPMWPQFRKAALRDLELALQTLPEQVDALQMVARLNMLPDGDKKRALEALDEGIRVSQSDPPAKAECLILKVTLEEKNEKKIELLDEAIKADTESAEAYRMRGSVYADMDQSAKAIDDLRKASQLAPEHPLTLLALGMALFDQATSQEEGKQPDEAEQKKLLDEASQAFEKTSELVPRLPQPLLHMGQIHALRGEFDKALEVLDKAHELDPGNLSVLLMRASVYQELDKLDLALADVKRALEDPGMNDETRSRVKKFQAMLLAGSDNLDKAIDVLKELQKTSPDDTSVTLQMGTFYSSEEQHEKAVEMYSKVLEKEPDNKVALRLRGDAYLSLGKHAEAIADLEKAVELMPDDSGTLNNLAWVLCTSPKDELRNPKRAIELATKACEVTEYKAAHILSTLAAAYADSGDMETAKKWSRKAVEVAKADEEDDPETLGHLEEELKSYEQGKPWRELMLPSKKKEAEKEQGEKPSDPPRKKKASKPKESGKSEAKPQADEAPAPKETPKGEEAPKADSGPAKKVD
ncbi:MAG: tetratricopeptide repeat protein [Thermoguttaceae bacterium]